MRQAIQRPIALVRNAPDRRHLRISAYTLKYAWKMFPNNIKPVMSTRFQVRHSPGLTRLDG